MLHISKVYYHIKSGYFIIFISFLKTKIQYIKKYLKQSLLYSRQKHNMTSVFIETYA